MLSKYAHPNLIIRVIKTADGMFAIENQNGNGQPKRWTAVRPTYSADQANKIARKSAEEFGARFEGYTN